MLKTLSIATAVSALTIGSVATLTQAIEPATLIAVGAQAAPHVISGVKSVASQIYKARSVVLEVDNRTDVPLQAVSSSHKHGGFLQLLPHGQIPPGHYSVFTSGAIGVATGTEGNVTYAGDGFNLVVYWKNPYVGSNKCWTNLSGPNAGNYQVFSPCGRGNKGAHMRYELSKR